MYRAELYMEFSEDCTRMETVSKEELHDKLTEFHYCAIIEKEHSTYQIYCSDCIKNNPNSKKEEKYHLKLDPVARVRFEGGLDEYEKLLEEIRMDFQDGKIYGKLREGNAENDFLVVDIYFKM